MPTGHWNLDIIYCMGNTFQGATVREKDLTISADMNVSEQCDIAVSKSSRVANSWVD